MEELAFGMRFSVAYLKHEMASNSAATNRAIQLAYHHRCHRTRQPRTASSRPCCCRLAWRSGVDRPGMSNRTVLGCDGSSSLLDWCLCSCFLCPESNHRDHNHCSVAFDSTKSLLLGLRFCWLPHHTVRCCLLGLGPGRRRCSACFLLGCCGRRILPWCCCSVCSFELLTFSLFDWL